MSNVSILNPDLLVLPNYKHQSSFHSMTHSDAGHIDLSPLRSPAMSYLISCSPYLETLFIFLYPDSTRAVVCSSTLDIIIKMSDNLSPSVPDGPAFCLKTYHRWFLTMRANGVISAFCLLSDADMFNRFLQPWPLIIIALPLQLGVFVFWALSNL